MTALTLKLQDRSGYVIDSPCRTYTIFAEGYPYSMGYVKNTFADDTWTVYCLTRRDIGLGLVPTETFPTRAEALAHIRAVYDAAEAKFDARCAEVREILHRELSPIVEAYRPYDRPVRVTIIDCKDHADTITMTMNVQEALTALDWLYARSEQRFVITIEGAISSDKEPYRHSYCGWKVPALEQDYHLMGYRSTTGEGRRHTNEFYAAINNWPKRSAAA